MVVAPVTTDTCFLSTLPEEEDSCDPYSGLFLPRGGDFENDLPQGVKIVVYMLGLFWCFSGVAIISEVFMGAIEKVTSKKRIVYNKTTGRNVTVKVWNDTVANLTLMALGSSAPEILLSLIELIAMNGFKSGELGPSTIVGSAAFNLFCITAACIPAIPNGEIRNVKDTGVYSVTATFSILAYLWLVFIVQFSSKDVIEEWEGAATFLFFPVLVTLAYIADRGCFGQCSQKGKISEDKIAALQERIRSQYGDSLTDEQVQMLLEYELSKMTSAVKASRAAHRIGATRNMFGGKRISITDNDPQVTKQTHTSTGSTMLSSPTLSSKSCNTIPSTNFPQVGPDGNPLQLYVTPCDGTCDGCGRRTRKGDVVMDCREHNWYLCCKFCAPRVIPQEEQSFAGFATTLIPVLESHGTVQLKVKRSGNMEKSVMVEYSTRDGTAKKNSDYYEVHGVLEFGPDEDEKTVEVRIIDDEEHEDNEEFYVDLVSVDCPENPGAAIIDESKATATVLIIDDDHPGQLGFDSDSMQVNETGVRQTIGVSILRTLGGCGAVTCSYRTEDDSAIAGKDFVAMEGELEFKPGELEKVISLEILPKGRYDGKERFRILLENITGGATFDPETDGGKESCILTVYIISDPTGAKSILGIGSGMMINWDRAEVGNSNWREQFMEAVFCGGSLEAQRECSWAQLAFHLIVMPWKLLFALVPPTDFLGGWLCFGVSLVAIGLVTAVIGDMANLLGCAMPGFTPSITAITFVALGTSLPDTFASRTAAQQDPHADASIGNVTGSNSVNVFLGLGLPWLIGAIYWKIVGPTEEWKLSYVGKIPTDICLRGAFVVSSEGLSFSVLLFSILALVAILFLFLRRRLVGGELGGNSRFAWGSSVFLVSLWVTYVGVSIWNIKTGTF